MSPARVCIAASHERNDRGVFESKLQTQRTEPGARAWSEHAYDDAGLDTIARCCTSGARSFRTLEYEQSRKGQMPNELAFAVKDAIGTGVMETTPDFVACPYAIGGDWNPRTAVTGCAPHAFELLKQRKLI